MPLLFLFLYIFSPAPPSGEFPWCEDRPLSWADFRGPAKDWDVAAVTYCSISLTPERSGPERDEWRWIVVASFNADSSFYFPSKADAQVLAHEQLHFDIAELYARKIRQALDVHPALNSEKAHRIYTQLYTDYAAFQAKYDLETKSGIDKDEQQKWQEKVGKMMQQLARYKEKKNCS